jgi:hypothetical protein
VNAGYPDAVNPVLRDLGLRIRQMIRLSINPSRFPEDAARRKRAVVSRGNREASPLRLFPVCRVLRRRRRKKDSSTKDRGRLSEVAGTLGSERQCAMKPANWIPRDELLARAVRPFRQEGHSLSRIARELRVNRRTVSRLCTNEMSGKLRSEKGSATGRSDFLSLARLWM